MLDAGRGAIVNTSSSAAIAPAPRIGAYSAAKAGVVALTQQTTLEWSDRGIRANAILPGMMESSMGGNALLSRSEAQLAAVPLERLGLYREIGEPAAFLLSDGAAYMTGTAIPVDGGITLGIMRELMRG